MAFSSNRQCIFTISLMTFCSPLCCILWIYFHKESLGNRKLMTKNVSGQIHIRHLQNPDAAPKHIGYPCTPSTLLQRETCFLTNKKCKEWHQRGHYGKYSNIQHLFFIFKYTNSLYVVFDVIESSHDANEITIIYCKENLCYYTGW